MSKSKRKIKSRSKYPPLICVGPGKVQDIFIIRPGEIMLVGAVTHCTEYLGQIWKENHKIDSRDLRRATTADFARVIAWLPKNKWKFPECQKR